MGNNWSHTKEAKQKISSTLRATLKSTGASERSAESRYKSGDFRESLILDPENEHLRQYRWGSHGGYARGRTPEGYVYLHHLILPVKSGYFIDHKNGDTKDNRRSNLRYASAVDNQRNRRPGQSNNSSGYKGVSWHKSKRKWTASIRVDKKLVYLGAFSDIVEAARAYDRAAIERFGSFARTNICQQH